MRTISNSRLREKKWLSGNCRSEGKIWGYLGGETTKIPPYILSTTEIPKDPKKSAI